MNHDANIMTVNASKLHKRNKSDALNHVISRCSNPIFDIKALRLKPFTELSNDNDNFSDNLKAFQKCQHEKPIKVFKCFPFNVIGGLS